MTRETRARDTAGRFASAEHSRPELALSDVTAGPVQNTDGHYGWETPLLDEAEIDPGERQAWVESFIDDYFAGPEPVLAQARGAAEGSDPFGDAPAVVTPF